MTPKFVTRFNSEGAGDRYLHIQVVKEEAGRQARVVFLYSEDPEKPPGYDRTIGPSPPAELQKTAKEIMRSFGG